MNKILKKLIAAGALTLVTSSSVLAQPSPTNGSNSKQQTESIEMNIEKLDNQIEDVMSKIDKSKKEISKTQNDIKSTYVELDKSKNEGDEIDNHTYTHDYKYIYLNPQNLINDFNKGASTIKSILREDFNIKYVRFPGGSFGQKLKPFRAAVQNAGLKYVDWNSLNGDAEGQNIPVNKLIQNIRETSKGKNSDFNA